ncbi:MAG: zinc-ribbon domain-containing protein [Rhodobacteraceae bacterium]|jgi:predicted Zn finger-like uncharacterized protein|nr:zinc-ribbon domain-containing protein [Paracoccaceae bacterium]
MRITCPNCGAQYEVDARVIPDMGRDVQCSNCGHTWFQRPQSAVAASVRRVVEDPPVSPGPDADAPPAEPETTARAADAVPPIPPADGPGSEPTPGATPPTTAAEAPPVQTGPEAAATPVADPAEPAAAGPEPAVTAPPPAEGERPVLDDATRALLREEAAREAQARAAERRPAIETQGDFGLTATPAAPLAPRTIQRSADLSGATDGPGTPLAVAVAAASSRRDNLPDVAAITSGLRVGDAATRTAADGAEVPPRRGFRAGFLVPILFVVAAALVYLLAPTLAEAVPALRDPLASYVDSVNGLRAWIAGALGGSAG